MSFDADKDKLVPGVGGYSHDNFFSLENESSFPHNQSDDNLSDRLNENETGHNILYSSVMEIRLNQIKEKVILIKVKYQI